MIIGAYRTADADEMVRIAEYSPPFHEQRFAAHERFFVEDVRGWVRSRFGVALPAERTGRVRCVGQWRARTCHGTSASRYLRCRFCASPGAGYRPPTLLPSPLPRTYLVAGTSKPFFLKNANRWAGALRDAGADVVMRQRVGNHGDPFWAEEFPRMVAWAFGS